MKSNIYFLFAKDERNIKYIKIGQSIDVPKRIKQLQTGCPFKIVKAKYLELDKTEVNSYEKAFHFLFRKFRNNNEWFAFPEQDGQVFEVVDFVFRLTLGIGKDWVLKIKTLIFE